MNIAHNHPATHAGSWMDQIARVDASSSVQGRPAWRPGEELLMERAIKRPRMVTIQLSIVNIQISLRPRRDSDQEHKLADLVERGQMARTLRRERDMAYTHLLLRG
jgi:hypothetical protein